MRSKRKKASAKDKKETLPVKKTKDKKEKARTENAKWESIAKTPP